MFVIYTCYNFPLTFRSALSLWTSIDTFQSCSRSLTDPWLIPDWNELYHFDTAIVCLIVGLLVCLCVFVFVSLFDCWFVCVCVCLFVFLLFLRDSSKPVNTEDCTYNNVASRFLLCVIYGKQVHYKLLMILKITPGHVTVAIIRKMLKEVSTC
jgi:hypothetical protein